MEILDAIKKIKYPDIIDCLSSTPKDKELHFRIKRWYSSRLMVNKNNYITYELLNLVLIISMRKQQGRIPPNEYLNKTLDTMFAQGIKSLEDGINYFKNYVVSYEIQKQKIKTEAKEIYKDNAVLNKTKQLTQNKQI